MRHAVIMAGGAGTRLWPLSRTNRPKQLLRLFEGKSLLRHSFERLRGLFGPEAIHVITSADHLPAVASELPELPHENLMGEPCGRDTAAAIGLAAALLARRDPDGVMGVFTADHLIRPVDRFQAVVQRGYETAERFGEALVTFGIRISEPHTGYGHIQRGQALADGVYEVRQFKEKPDRQTAEQYFRSGQYYWNSGMFVWRLDTILSQFAQHLPETLQKVRHIAEVWDAPEGRATAGQLYPTLEKISIDYAVMEKAEQVVVVEMDCEWLDVGSWTALASAFPADADGNVRVLQNAATLDSKGNVLVAEDDHLIATIGLEDIVVVHSPDATLVCRKQDAQRLKQMVERLREQFGSRYL